MEVVLANRKVDLIFKFQKRLSLRERVKSSNTQSLDKVRLYDGLHSPIVHSRCIHLCVFSMADCYPQVVYDKRHFLRLTYRLYCRANINELLKLAMSSCEKSSYVIGLMFSPQVRVHTGTIRLVSGLQELLGKLIEPA